MRVLFYREYVDLLEDILSALMLSQIVYWYLPDKKGNAKLKVYKKGNWWLVKSFHDWFDEIGLTRRQSQRCIQILVKKGVVETSLHKFDGTPTMHIRLLCAKGSQILREAPSQLYTIGAIGFGAVPDTSGCTSLHPQVQSLTDTTAEITAETKFFGSLANELQEKKNGILYIPEVVTSLTPPTPPFSIGEEDMKASDVIQNMLSKKSPPEVLAARWKYDMALVYGGWQKGLTIQELSQLKSIQKQIGKEATLTLITWVINHWNVFGGKATNQSGNLWYPPKPNPGFFLKYFDIAVNLQSIALPADSVPETVCNVSEVVSVPQVSNNLNSFGEEIYHPSQEEIKKLIAELEGKG
jgi:hypothetical protein